MRNLRPLILAMSVAFALTLGLLLPPLITRAATLTVGPNGTYTTIQAALDVASDGDTVQVESGTYTENVVISKSVTLLGGYDSSFSTRTPRTSIIDGSNASCPTVGLLYACGTPLTADNGIGIAAFTPPTSPDAIDLTLDGFEVTGGSDSGLYLLTNQDSHVELIDLLIQSNSTITDGGGLYAEINNRATVVISATDVLTNVAGEEGGGLLIKNDTPFGSESISPTLLIYSTVISDNVALYASGMDIDLENFARVELHDLLIQNNGLFTYTNQDTQYGGMDIDLVANSSIFVNNLSLIGNQAYDDGGGKLDLSGEIDAWLQNIYVGYNSSSPDGSDSGLEIEGDENVQITVDRIVAEYNSGEGQALEVDLEDRSALTVTELLSITNNIGDGSTAGVQLDPGYNAEIQVPLLYVENNNCQDCSGAGAYVGSSNYRGRTFLDDVVIRSNTNISGSGGGMYVSGTDGNILTIPQGLVEDNYAGSNGGGIYFSSISYGNEVNLTNVSFITNTALSNGGGAYWGSSYDGVRYTVEDNTFTDNYAGSSGGGLYISGEFAEECTYADFNRNTFNANRSAGSGGGLYASYFFESCDGTFIGNSFRNNVAGGGGGGLYASSAIAYEGSHVTVRDNVFEDNVADGDGGGARLYKIADNGSTVLFDNNTFAGNRAGYSSSGGGLYVSSELIYEGGFLTMTNNLFAENWAGNDGGGMRVNDDLVDNADLYFGENTVVENIAGDDGGGMSFNNFTYEGTRVQFRNNIISRNTITGTDGNGGGIDSEGTYDGDMLWFTGNVITGNVATGKGGGHFIDDYLEYGSYVEWSDNVISDNYAEDGGGGCWFDDVWEEGTEVYFVRNDISRNRSGNDAGGCYFDDIEEGALADMSELTVADNWAASDGGGLYFEEFSDDGAELLLRESQIIDNRAGYSGTVATGGNGGGLYFNEIDGGHRIEISHNTIARNRAYTMGVGTGLYGAIFITDVQNFPLILLEENDIYDNVADSGYGGVSLWMTEGRLLVERNRIANNEATSGPGSGLVLMGIDFDINPVNVEAIFDSNVITGNTATVGSGLSVIHNSITGTLYTYGLNNLIADNDHGLAVGGMAYLSVNDTIANNTNAGIDAVYPVTTSIQITNGILWGNGTEVADPGVTSIDYSIVEGGYAGTSNLDSDPLFVNEAGGDYHLQAASPAIDSALTAAAPTYDLEQLFRPVGADADRGAYEWRIAGVSTVGPPPNPMGTPGGSTTFQITVTNDSNYQDTFMVSVEGNEKGWPTNVVPPSVTLNPGESTVVEVEVDVPNDAPGGSENELQIVVKSQSNPFVVQSLNVTVEAEEVADVSISPDNSTTTLPDSAVVYAHTVSNDGNFTDTISLLATSDAGWAATAVPAVTSLAPGASTTVMVTVTVPAGTGGTTDVTTVSATSSASAGTTSDEASDTTTVTQVAGVKLTSGTVANTTPGAAVEFTHRITNTGNGPDTFDLSYVSSTGWTVNGPSSVALDAGEEQTIVIEVEVPASAEGTSSVTTIMATSTVDGAMMDMAQDTVIVAGVGVQVVPDNEGLILPGETLVYTHTVVNTGSTTDTFDLTYDSSAGWTVSGPDSITVGAGDATEVVYSVTMPLESEQEEDVTTMTATSQLDASKTDSATSRSVVGEQRQFLPFLPFAISSSQ